MTEKFRSQFSTLSSHKFGPEGIAVLSAATILQRAVLWVWLSKAGFMQTLLHQYVPLFGLILVRA